MTEPAVFDPLRLLRALSDGRVRYIAIGAFAGRLHGSPTITRELDICPARDQANLDALATVLLSLHARPRGVEPGLPFRLDGRTLAAGGSFTFTTDAGDLDVLGAPAGTSGFEDLAGGATVLDLDGLTVLAASLDDLIRMKRAAGRPKDLIELEVLGALREEIERAEPPRERR